MEPTRYDRIVRRPEEERTRDAFPRGFPQRIDVATGRYVDPAFLALDQQYLFEAGWLFVAHADELPNPGDYRMLDALDRIGHPLFLVLRGADQRIRAFYNACRHRGGPLVDAPSGSTGKRLVCKYHAWTCDLDGWGGIGLYRWNGKVLLENFVEPDFLAQEEQLATGVPAPLETPHLDPWTTTRSEPANPEAESTVRARLGKGDLCAADGVTDGSWYGPRAPSLLDVEAVEVNVLFSAGTRVGFHVTQRGRYRDGFAGGEAAWIGRPSALRCVGLARVEGGAVRAGHAITDRLGTRTALAHGADRAPESLRS